MFVNLCDFWLLPRNLQIFGKFVRFPYQRIKCSFDLLPLWDWNFCSIYSIFPEKLRNSEWTRQGCLLPSHPHSLVVIEFQQSCSPCFLCCFYGGVVINALLEASGLLARCCVGHPALPGWLKPPMRSRAWWHKAVSSCLWKPLSTSSAWFGSL